MISTGSPRSEPAVNGSGAGPAPTAGQAAPTTEAPAREPRPVRSRGTWLVVAWLVVIGGAAAVVGGRDAVSGGEITVRVVGAMLAGAGAVMLVGAAAFAGAHRSGRALAVVGAALGIVLGALGFLAQVVNDEPDRRLALWATVIVGSVTAALHLHARRSAEERSEGLLGRLPFVKSVVSVGVLLSFGQFWLTSVHLPATAPASLTIEAAIERVVEVDGRLLVQAAATIRNTSGTRVNVLASAWNVRGEDALAHRLGNRDFSEAIRQADRGEVLAANRYAGSAEVTIAGHGRVVRDGFYFEPDEAVKVPIVAWLPVHGYDLAHLDLSVTVARARALALEMQEERPQVREADPGVVTVVKIPDTGWVRGLVRGDRYLHVTYEDDPKAPGTLVSFARDRTSTGPSAFSDRLERFYGVGVAEAGATQPLPVR